MTYVMPTNPPFFAPTSSGRARIVASAKKSEANFDIVISSDEEDVEGEEREKGEVDGGGCSGD